MTACLSLFVTIHWQTLLSSIAVAAGLCVFLFGLRLLAKQRFLLWILRSTVADAVPGLREVYGAAAGADTLPAPITGQACFLYRVTAWRQRTGDGQQWEKVADETSQVPFHLEDSGGRLLIDPFSADIDLPCEFREDYDEPFFSATTENFPPRVSAFLFRHGIASGCRLRIEERLIRLGDAIFVAGTVAENQGVADQRLLDQTTNAELSTEDRVPAPHLSAETETVVVPQVIRLAAAAAAGALGSSQMGQQAKIAAALTRAGVATTDLWSSIEVTHPTPSMPGRAITASGPPRREALSREDSGPTVRLPESKFPSPSDLDLTPTFILKRGPANPTFVISFESPKERARELARKSVAMVVGGAVMTSLALLMLWLQMMAR